MARVLSAFVLEKVSIPVTRRGYAAAQGSASGGAVRGNMVIKKGAEESGNKVTTSWVPDPVTGYYKPESHVNEVDAAELRMMLFKNRKYYN